MRKCSIMLCSVCCCTNRQTWSLSLALSLVVSPLYWAMRLFVFLMLPLHTLAAIQLKCKRSALHTIRLLYAQLPSAYIHGDSPFSPNRTLFPIFVKFELRKIVTLDDWRCLLFALVTSKTFNVNVFAELLQARHRTHTDRTEQYRYRLCVFGP